MEVLIKPLVDTFKQVFGDARFLALSLITFFVILLFSIWLPNLSFVANTITSSTLTITQKTNLLAATFGGLETNFTTLSRILTILVSALFSVNTSLFIYYLKRRADLEKAAGTSFGGLVAGLLGIGCASCGSVILSSIFGISATAAFLAPLPLKGQEFGLLGVAALSVSIFLTAKRIQRPFACEE